MILKKTLFLAGCFSAFLFFTGCSRSESGRQTFGMLPKLVGIPYFNACEKGAREAADELGIELVYDGPDTADSNKQLEKINSWILRGFDVIAAAPNNPEAVAPVLAKAREKGIAVVTWDTDAAEASRQYFCNQVGYQAMAETLVDIVAEETDEKGLVALISGTETAANQNTWMGIMRTYMEEKYPAMRFVDPVEYPGEDEARAYQSARGLLNRAERPDALIGMTTVAAPAAAKAVFDAGLSGKVAVTGITLPSVMKQYVHNGTCGKFVLWDPEDFGYMTVYVGKLLADGKIPDNADSITAGRLGTLAIKGSGIILGDPLVFDKSNVDDYAF